MKKFLLIEDDNDIAELERDSALASDRLGRRLPV